MARKLTKGVAAETRKNVLVQLLLPKLNALIEERLALNLKIHESHLPAEILSLYKNGHAKYFQTCYRTGFCKGYDGQSLTNLCGLTFVTPKNWSSYDTFSGKRNAEHVEAGTSLIRCECSTAYIPHHSVAISDNPISDEELALYGDLYAREEGLITLWAETHEMLHSVLAMPTVERAAELWPDVLKYVPKEVVAVSNLPAIKPAEVTDFFSKLAQPA
ncbi:hypothetical protein [Chitinibacter tainanensis]|uniref:hypothetical protein n=1 Tax=Chitinibacter tainanensis TaxID=230667 RepID=UPI00040A3912|nr:hypothetical protein [Chitinibacter tainanensis]